LARRPAALDASDFRYMARDLRRYARQTNFRLTVGFILLLFTVGIGLIYIFYGQGGALMGLVCILLGLAPVILIGLALAVMEWIVQRANRD